MDISKIDYESLFSKIGSYAKKAGAVAARPLWTALGGAASLAHPDIGPGTVP